MPRSSEIRGRSIAKFNELHPDTPVTFEGVPSASWPDKIAAMVAGGNAPDVITLGAPDMVQYATRGALAPLDDFVPALFRADLFDTTVLDLGRMNGKIYGVPIAVSIQGLACNLSALQRLGMGEPPAAWTYEEFAKVCAEIHRADPQLHGSHDGAARLDTFQMHLMSQGRSLYDGKKLAVTVDDVAQWLDYWDKMRKSGGAVPADLQAQFTGTEWPNSPLVKGKAVFASIASQDLAGGYQALTKDTLSITTPPSAGAGASPGYYPQPTSSLCLYAKSGNKEAAVKVIDWFVSDPASARILGLISGPPASKPALEAVLELEDLAPVDERVLKYSRGRARQSAARAPAAEGRTRHRRPDAPGERGCRLRQVLGPGGRPGLRRSRSCADAAGLRDRAQPPEPSPQRRRPRCPSIMTRNPPSKSLETAGLVAPALLGIPDQSSGNRCGPGRREDAGLHRGVRGRHLADQHGGHRVLLSDGAAVPDAQPIPCRPALGGPDRRCCGGGAPPRHPGALPAGLLQGLRAHRKRAPGLALRVAGREAAGLQHSVQHLPVRRLLPASLTRDPRRDHRPLSGRRLLLQLVRLLRTRLQSRLSRCLPPARNAGRASAPSATDRNCRTVQPRRHIPNGCGSQAR